MITYKKGNLKYNYRAGVLLINEKNEILVQNKKKYDFWILPGGRIEFLETSEQAIEREMKEELNLIIHPERVVVIAEIVNHKENYHENLVFYLKHIDLTKEKLINIKNVKCIDDNEIIFKWLDINKIDEINLYPGFLKNIIKNIPEEIQHKKVIVN